MAFKNTFALRSTHFWHSKALLLLVLLTFGVAKNRALIDGNNRIAAAMVVLLALNAIPLAYTQRALADLFFGVAGRLVNRLKMVSVSTKQGGVLRAFP